MSVTRDVRTEEMLLNMGPQHPSTHGVFRVVIRTDGEMVLESESHIGYLHRCFEKCAEGNNYIQVVPYTDRMDYLCAMLEQPRVRRGRREAHGARGPPERALYIRIIVCRAESHRQPPHGLRHLWSRSGRDHRVPLFLSRPRADPEDLREDLRATAELQLRSNRWSDSFDITDEILSDISHLHRLLRSRRSSTSTTTSLSYNGIFISRTAKVGTLIPPETGRCDHGVTGPVAPRFRCPARPAQGRAELQSTIASNSTFPSDQGEVGAARRLLGSIHGAHPEEMQPVRANHSSGAPRHSVRAVLRQEGLSRREAARRARSITRSRARVASSATTWSPTARTCRIE